VKTFENSVLVLGPPLSLYYDEPPEKSCQVHVSGIPDWAAMSDVVEIFERFGKLYRIELSVSVRIDLTMKEERKEVRECLACNGSARVHFMTYDGAQKALDSHLSRRIPGTLTPLSIYKGVVSNVVLLKNLPPKEPKAKIIDRLHDYPGLLRIDFLTPNAARLVFYDLDLALLFMDVVSGDGLVISGFTCIVEPENPDAETDEDEAVSDAGSV